MGGDSALEMELVEALGSVTCRSNVDVLTLISAEHFKLLSPTSSAEKPVRGPTEAAVSYSYFLFAFYWLEICKLPDHLANKKKLRQAS